MGPIRECTKKHLGKMATLRKGCGLGQITPDDELESADGGVHFSSISLKCAAIRQLLESMSNPPIVVRKGVQHVFLE